ncbi:MAG: class I SAM-dependent methyltransferase [Planctomycetes bacterium]|nr:class I SAM-dependent methyltransferase [Planctomycetota bacterium]
MTSCLVCGRDAVREFLDLGRTALANRFLAPEELNAAEPVFRLRVGFCPTCAHIQLLDRVPAAALFDHYLYVSSASDTLKDHLHDLARVLVARCGLGPRDLVVDIGSNDGTLLAGFLRQGTRVLGVDPARNLAAQARKAGVETLAAYFGSEAAGRITERWGKAAVVTATNTFPHVQDLGDFLAGIDRVLAPGGTLVLEMHYLVDLLEVGAFDTIYHEHVSYWSLGAMRHLFRRHGFEAVDVKRLPLHHGQLRVFVRRAGQEEAAPSVEALMGLERERGLHRYETFEAFARETRRIREDLKRTLSGLRAAGKRVAGYGAPAKCSTLLTFLDVGPDEVEYIVDRSPLKQGRYTPGTHIPIVAPERLLADRPDYVVLFAWNFADEVMAQQAEFRRQGGSFIIPLPVVRVV